MEKLLEIEESLGNANMPNEDESNYDDIFSSEDLGKQHCYLLKMQNDILLDVLLGLCNKDDFYLKVKSIEIMSRRYSNALRDDPNSSFWTFVRATLTTEEDHEIVNFLLKCLRNFFLENLEREQIFPDLNTAVVFEKQDRKDSDRKDQRENVGDTNPNNACAPDNQSSKTDTGTCSEKDVDDINIILKCSKFIPYSQRYDQRERVESFRVHFVSDTAVQRRLLSFIETDDFCYNALFLIWLLSFTEKVFDKLSAVDLIEALENKIRKDTQDKIVRMACLVLMNLKEHDLFISLKNLHRMLNISKIMLNRKSEDLEYNHDKKELYNYIMKRIKNVSSVDNYLKELYSGHLEPTLYHFEESFWNVNLGKLQIKKHEIIKAIRLYLKRGERQNVVMALNDLFMFHNVDASIGRLIENYGVKEQLIELCGSNDGEIQFLALQAFLSVLNQQLY
ncbi:Vacuolar H+-ATPase V1 sector, subunit H [Trachipleistophora hominis]|uniref:Vacuolar H+-ATPase V1 sector, subunit H n=1 Tax=Trachipleistophora hominis TaxID=72359 RepID=L7JUU0_TRAHO|nr:Vacuolar H+-ATPase V1 sector, subunit H [Trachipleistophora hominis]